MSRLNEITKFIENGSVSGLFIESEKWKSHVGTKLFEAIGSYEPGVIVKAGLGAGDILIDIAKNTKALIAVVEPSLKAINNFLNKIKTSHRGFILLTANSKAFQ